VDRVCGGAVRRPRGRVGPHHTAPVRALTLRHPGVADRTHKLEGDTPLVGLRRGRLAGADWAALIRGATGWGSGVGSEGIGGVRVGVPEAQDMAGAPGLRRAGTDRAGSATADGARSGQPLATTVRDEVWWPHTSPFACRFDSPGRCCLSPLTAPVTDLAGDERTHRGQRHNHSAPGGQAAREPAVAAAIDEPELGTARDPRPRRSERPTRRPPAAAAARRSHCRYIGWPSTLVFPPADLRSRALPADAPVRLPPTVRRAMARRRRCFLPVESRCVEFRPRACPEGRRSPRRYRRPSHRRRAPLRRSPRPSPPWPDP
jgi:hypothetical protein